MWFSLNAETFQDIIKTFAHVKGRVFIKTTKTQLTVYSFQKCNGYDTIIQYVTKTDITKPQTVSVLSFNTLSKLSGKISFRIVSDMLIAEEDETKKTVAISLFGEAPKTSTIKGTKYTLDGKTFKKAIQTAQVATGHKFYTDIRFTLNESGYSLIAHTEYLLAMYSSYADYFSTHYQNFLVKHHFVSPSVKCLLPKNIMRVIPKFFWKDSITLYISDNSVTFKQGNVSAIFKTEEGITFESMLVNYPKYKRIIDCGYSPQQEIVTDTKQLLQALKTIKKTNPLYSLVKVKLDTSFPALHLIYDGKKRITLPCSYVISPAPRMLIGYNVEFLVSILKQIKTPSVMLSCFGTLEKLVIREFDERISQDKLFALMPMELDEKQGVEK